MLRESLSTSDFSSRSLIHSHTPLSTYNMSDSVLGGRNTAQNKTDQNFCLRRASNLVILMFPLKIFCFKNVRLSGNTVILQPMNRNSAPLLPCLTPSYLSIPGNQTQKMRPLPLEVDSKSCGRISYLSDNLQAHKERGRENLR